MQLWTHTGREVDKNTETQADLIETNLEGARLLGSSSLSQPGPSVGQQASGEQLGEQHDGDEQHDGGELDMEAEIVRCWPSGREKISNAIAGHDEEKAVVTVVLTACLLLPAVIAAVVMAAANDVVVTLVVVGVIGLMSIAFIALSRNKMQKGHHPSLRWSYAPVCIWFAGALMLVLPTSMMASGTSTAAVPTAGIIAFVTMVWLLGFVFLWYKADGINPIEKRQHLVGLPPGGMMKLKMFTVANECYNYCGFSFFPALPWKAMVVPAELPHPQMVMLAGFLEFGDTNTHFWVFLGAELCVVLSFLLLLLARNNMGHKLLVIQVFFDLLSFPLMKRLTSVFSCTSASIWAENEAGILQRVCDSSIADNGQCMDNDASVQCWENAHLGYTCTVMVVLVPYYLATLHLQTVAQVRTPPNIAIAAR